MRQPHRKNAERPAATPAKVQSIQPRPAASASPSADAPEVHARLDQLENLLHIVTRSQENYRKLIDSLDDVMFSVTLQGEICAVNQRFAELAELPFSDIVGRNLESILEEPTLEEAL